MRVFHSNKWSPDSKSITPSALRVALVSLIAVAALAAIVPSAGAIPPRGRQRNTSAFIYPPAFVAFMDTQYGRLWMHTVQEQVIRRMYMTWIEKNCNPDKKDR